MSRALRGDRISSSSYHEEFLSLEERLKNSLLRIDKLLGALKAIHTYCWQMKITVRASTEFVKQQKRWLSKASNIAMAVCV